jgi:cytochrome c-type biogenesis protein CcmH/NrfF
MNPFARLGILLLVASALGPGLEAGPSAEDRYQQWAEALVPPCCRQGSLKNHDSEAARQAQHELRGMIDQGYTDERIQDEFVDRYGAAMLMTPDGKRGQWLFTMPAAFLLISALGAAWFLRRMLRRAPAHRLASAPSIEIEDDELDR